MLIDNRYEFYAKSAILMAVLKHVVQNSFLKSCLSYLFFLCLNRLRLGICRFFSPHDDLELEMGCRHNHNLSARSTRRTPMGDAS